MWPFKNYNQKEKEYYEQKAHRRAERDQWRCQNGLTKFSNILTGLGVVISLVAAAGAVAASIFAKDAFHAAVWQARIANETNIATNRAWLYPENFLITVPSDGSPATITGDNKNVGKEPAKEVLFSRADGNFVEKQGTDARTYRIPSEDICQGYEHWTDESRRTPTGPPNGGTIFPDQTFTFERLFSIGAPTQIAAYNAMIDSGQLIYYFRSCVGYVTFREHHKSAFCFYMEYDPIKHQRITYHCPTGNDAN